MGLNLRKSGNLPTSISINNSTRFGIFGKKYLMDLYGISAAGYSLRRLNSRYTGPAIRARKQVSSSDVYEEIGFDSSGNLDTTSLTTFASNADNGDVFVQTWYDQAGNNDATQITANRQPKIVSSGALVTGINSKPSLLFNNSLLSANRLISTNTWFISLVAKFNDTVGNEPIINQHSGDPDVNRVVFAQGLDGDIVMFFNNGTSYIGTHTTARSTSPVLITSRALSDDYFLSINSSEEEVISNQSLTPLDTTFNIGAVGDLNSKLDGHLSEIIVYTSDKSALRTQIEDEINGHYNIYTP